MAKQVSSNRVSETTVPEICERWRLDFGGGRSKKIPNLLETFQLTQIEPDILVGIDSVEIKSNGMRNVSGNSQEQNSNHQKFSAYIAFSMLSFSFLVLFSQGTILLHQRDVPKQILIEYDQ